MVLAQLWGFAVDPDKCRWAITQLYENVPHPNDERSEPASVDDIHFLLSTAEGGITAVPSHASCGQDWLIARALLNKDFSSPSRASVLQDFPKVMTLLQKARQHLAQR